MKQKNEYHMNIGGASIILLIIVFALTVFAVLSVRASYHEMKLAQKTRESVEKYYKLDKSALEMKTDIENSFRIYMSDDSLNTDEKIKGFNYSDDCKLFSETDSLGNTECKLSFSKEYEEKKLNVTIRLNRDGSCDLLEWRLNEYEHGDYNGGQAGDIGDIVIID